MQISIEEKRKAVTLAIQRLLAEGKYKSNELARILGKSSGYISNINKDNEAATKYKDEVFEKWYFNPVLEIVNPSVKVRKTEGVLETKNYIQIGKICDSAKERSTEILVVGNTGMGKTTCLRDYAYVRNPTNTYYIYCTAAMTQHDLITAIAKAVKLEKMEGKKLHDLITDLMEALARKNKPLIIIDEASKLKPSTFIVLQSLMDGTTGTGGECGFVLAGIKKLAAVIQRKAELDKLGFSEMRRRLGEPRILSEKYEVEELELFCDYFGLSRAETIATKAKCLGIMGDFGSIKKVIKDIIYSRTA